MGSSVRTALFSLAIVIMAVAPVAAQEESQTRVCITVLACGLGPKGDFKTFSTPCAARDAGYIVHSYGYCESEGGICPRNVKPVCGTGLDNQRHTYPNECTAKAAGAKRVRKGKCKKEVPLLPILLPESSVVE